MMIWEFQNVSIELIRLKELSFSIKLGEISVITGEIGSGKSTLLNLLQRFYIIDSGDIYLNDRTLSIYELDLFRWRNSIGVISQDTFILNGNVLNNISLSFDNAELKECIKFCEKYGFNFYFKKFYKGYDTILGEDGASISGGQKQLIALARALFKQPKVLLLDEPTSAMDSDCERFTINLLKKLKFDILILMVSHRDNIINISDNILMLESGYIYSKKVNLPD